MNETIYDIFDIGFNKFLSRETPLVLDTSSLDLPSPSALDSIITSGTSPVNLTSGEWVGNISIKDGYLRSANFVTGSAGWKLNYDGVFEATAGIFSGTITATSGTIGGWNITVDRLQSAASGVRVELDKANLRVSIFDATNEKVVMGYLNGLPKNDGTGNWGASNYGFWARSGDMLSIDGDGEFINGDWIIQNDASYLVNNASAQTIIRLGTDTGEKGLFIYNTDGVKLAKFISDQIYVGTSTNYLQYTVASGLKLYSNIANAITLDYGSNILLKEGGSIKFTSVTAPTACTATLVATDTGNVDNGTKKYRVTFVTGTGETNLGTVSNTVTVDATHKQINLSSIAVSTSSAVVSRNIYRSSDGFAYYLLINIANNTTTTYTDNIADADLGTDNCNNQINFTEGKIFLNDVVVSRLGKQVALGLSSLASITKGYDNTAIGWNALNSLTTGWHNIAIGNYALSYNVSGVKNVAIGYGALEDTTGDRNTAVGEWAGTMLSTGEGNTVIGYRTGEGNPNPIIGDYNTLVGAYAGGSGSGSYNVGIGANAITALSNDYNVNIGYQANCGGGSSIAIGAYAGYYSAADANSFYLNNQDRTDTAGDKAKSLLYGVMAAAAANQKLTINGLLNQSVSKTPAAANAAGTAGDICWDASNIYVCVATNTWKKAAIATW